MARPNFAAPNSFPRTAQHPPSYFCVAPSYARRAAFHTKLQSRSLGQSTSGSKRAIDVVTHRALPGTPHDSRNGVFSFFLCMGVCWRSGGGSGRVPEKIITTDAEQTKRLVQHNSSSPPHTPTLRAPRTRLAGSSLPTPKSEPSAMTGRENTTFFCVCVEGSRIRTRHHGAAPPKNKKKTHRQRLASVHADVARPRLDELDRRGGERLERQLLLQERAAERAGRAAEQQHQRRQRGGAWCVCQRAGGRVSDRASRGAQRINRIIARSKLPVAGQWQCEQRVQQQKTRPHSDLPCCWSGDSTARSNELAPKHGAVLDSMDPAAELQFGERVRVEQARFVCCSAETRDSRSATGVSPIAVTGCGCGAARCVAD